MLQTSEDVKAELNILREYLKRRQTIENEIGVLKDDLKQLNDEFKEKLDVKTLTLATAVARAKLRVAHKFTFENFLDVLETEGWVEKGK